MKIMINHIGFLPEASKKCILPNGDYKDFVIQDMQQVGSDVFGEEEDWKAVYTGKLIKKKYDFGEYSVGDFSEFKTPGMYRLKIIGTKISSYQFLISEKAFHNLPFLFLDYIHNWRAGNHGLHWRDTSTSDDGKRSDNGEQIDVSGGWYDAGDLRKWMVHSNLPAIGFMDFSEEKDFQRNYWASEQVSSNDFLTETAWAVKYILKMQDPQTAMFFEDVGGGGDARATDNAGWWYENHSGVLADNSENRFTDNIQNSGDERTVRVQYNPIVQYTNTYILLRAFRALKNEQTELAMQCQKAALANLTFMLKKSKDHYHGWTSVRAWKLMVATELYALKHIEEIEELLPFITDLIAIYDEDLAFWWMDENKEQPYRGILHSAQPLIALAKVCKYLDATMKSKINAIFRNVRDNYILPLSQTNPFGFMPYGLFIKPSNSVDVFRKFRKVYYRNFMPDNNKENINHGLAGHWMSWAHALSLMSKILKDIELKNLAFDQLGWLTGNNPYYASLITGVGYNHPMPHSRYLGNFPGGFMIGFIGLKDDMPYLDMEGNAQWNTTEYWNTPNANCMMAFSGLLS